MKLENKGAASIAITAGIMIFGIFSLITSLAVLESGKIGQWYYQSILFPFWGEKAIYFSIYILLVALIYYLSNRPILRFCGLTLLLLTVAMIADNSLSFKNAFSEYDIAWNLKNNSIIWFGTYGTYLLELLFMVAGALMLYPFKMKEKTPKVVKKQEKPEPEKKEKQIDVPSVASKQTEKANKEKKSGASPATSGERKIMLDRLDRKYKKIKIPDFSTFKWSKPKSGKNRCRHQDKIVSAFAAFGLNVSIGATKYGPFSEKYEIVVSEGTKRKEIQKLVNEGDIAAQLGIPKIRLTEGHKAELNLELLHKIKETIPLMDLLGDVVKGQKTKEYQVPVLLGVDDNYEITTCDLATMPHLLVAGTTGSGKSVLVKTIITSMMSLASPNDVKLVLVDPKQVEFEVFAKSDFLAGDVVNSVDETVGLIEELLDVMEERYGLFKSNGVPSLKAFNEKKSGFQRLPSVVVIVDEFADLMMMKKSNISDNIIRLAQKGRAAGIHLILATQRPSVNVINGLIKANIPGRIALKVTSEIDSRVIIDVPGAEKLSGRGHMIFVSGENWEVQAPFISDEEIHKLYS